MLASTIYSNVVNLRLSEVELVLEFGLTVPGTPGNSPRPGHTAFDPTARVIMSIQALKPLADMLVKAVDAQEKQQQEGHQQEQLREQGDASNTASQG